MQVFVEIEELMMYVSKQMYVNGDGGDGGWSDGNILRCYTN